MVRIYNKVESLRTKTSSSDKRKKSGPELFEEESLQEGRQRVRAFFGRQKKEKSPTQFPHWGKVKRESFRIGGKGERIDLQPLRSQWGDADRTNGEMRDKSIKR